MFQKRKAAWRAWMTAEEAVRVAEIDAAEARRTAESQSEQAERRLIANRAIQRKRYADRTRRQREAA